MKRREQEIQAECERALKRAELLRERDRIQQKTIEMIKQQLKLLYEGKMELQKELLSCRQKQLGGPPESKTLRDKRWEEIRQAYSEHVVHQVAPTIEYCKTVKPNKDDPYYLGNWNCSSCCSIQKNCYWNPSIGKRW